MGEDVMNKKKLAAGLISAALMTGGVAGTIANLAEDKAISATQASLQTEIDNIINQLKTSDAYKEYMNNCIDAEVQKYHDGNKTSAQVLEAITTIKSNEFAISNASKFMSHQDYLALKRQMAEKDNLENDLDVNFFKELGFGTMYALGIAGCAQTASGKFKNAEGSEKELCD